jgi:hypothetical protein
VDDLAAKIETLPPALQQEVEDFVDFLHSKYAPRKKGNMKLDWRGGLADLKDEYSSVELQHEGLRQWEERAGK